MIIKLIFPATTTCLTGNKFGRKIFTEQIKPKLDFCDDINVKLPATIDDVSTSFIQGFYTFLSNAYGKEEALSIMKFSSENQETEEKIRNVIKVYGI